MTDPLLHGNSSDVKNHLPNAENEVSAFFSILRPTSDALQSRVHPIVLSLRYGLLRLTRPQAHPGSQSSNANNQNTDRQGNSATNTSTSLKGAGDNSVAAPGADAALDIDLKSPRKQDHPAHNSSAGALHAAGANSDSHAQ